MTTPRICTPQTSPVVLTQAARSIDRHLRAVRTTLTRMIDDTGGKGGRDFTSEENRVFQVLHAIRHQFETIKVDVLG